MSSHGLLYLLASAGIVTGTAAQDYPTDGLRDDTRALSVQLRADLAHDLAATRAELGFEVWVTASTFLTSGQGIREHARATRQSWSGSADSVLLAYDRATDTLAHAFSPSLWQRYPTADIISLMQHGTAIMAEKRQPLDQRLARSIRDMLQRLHLLEKQRRLIARTLTADHVRLGKIFALGLLGGACALGIAGTTLRRLELLAASQSRFPVVQVGTRLGAPHGGGVMVQWQAQHG